MINLDSYTTNADRISAALRDVYTDSPDEYKYPWQYYNNR